MTKQDERTQPRRFWVWLFEYYPVVTLLVLVLALAALLHFGGRLDERLTHLEDSIGDSLRYREPEGTETQPTIIADAPGDVRRWYVPVHSHVYAGEGEAILLTITVSVRNTSSVDSLAIRAVRYIDAKGQVVREYVSSPVTLQPMRTIEYLVAESDTTGGSGAAFVVEFAGLPDEAEPQVEAVMIGAAKSQGISLVQRGVEIMRPTDSD